MKAQKEKLRKSVVLLKGKYTPQDLEVMSEEVFAVLEITGDFQSSKNIFIYNSLKDEVATKAFIEKWQHEKNFFLPVVKDNNLCFVPYHNSLEYNISALGVNEPIGDEIKDFSKIDMIIVPGIAFDRKMNRLGRGKGFYDRFLPDLKAKRVGVCFDFQLVDLVPTEKNDIKMDMIISENDLIW